MMIHAVLSAKQDSAKIQNSLKIIIKSHLVIFENPSKNSGVTPSSAGAENDDDSRRFFGQTRLPTYSIFHSNQCNIMLHADKNEFKM